jgi:hypothetical protein
MELSDDQQLKIDKTVLALVVCEEEDANNRYKVLRSSQSGSKDAGDQSGGGEGGGDKKQKKGKKVKKEGEGEVGEEEREEGEEEVTKDKEKDDEAKEEKEKEGDIFDILRAEARAEKDKGEASFIVKEDESSGLLPYVNNVQYLSDHIEWLSLR